MLKYISCRLLDAVAGGIIRQGLSLYVQQYLIWHHLMLCSLNILIFHTAMVGGFISSLRPLPSSTLTRSASLTSYLATITRWEKKKTREKDDPYQARMDNPYRLQWRVKREMLGNQYFGTYFSRARYP